jgi:hypothetical protein
VFGGLLGLVWVMGGVYGDGNGGENGGENVVGRFIVRAVWVDGKDRLEDRAWLT